jgi:hypothetical protein
LYFPLARAFNILAAIVRLKQSRFRVAHGGNPLMLSKLKLETLRQVIDGQRADLRESNTLTPRPGDVPGFFFTLTGATQ